MLSKKLYWKDDDRIRILISRNYYYTEKSWNKAVENSIPDHKEKLQIRYVENSFEFYALFNEADVCFCYLIRPDTDFTDCRLKDALGAGVTCRHVLSRS